MQFSEVKIGDTVYVVKEVAYGWNKSKSFQIPVKVTHVTNTTFIADGKKFRKTNGTEIGEYRGATKEGIDESEKMRAFEMKLAKAHAVQKLLSETKVTISNTAEQLQELEAALLKFQATTKV